MRRCETGTTERQKAWVIYPPRPPRCAGTEISGESEGADETAPEG